MIVVTDQGFVFYQDGAYEPGDIVIDPEKGLYRHYGEEWKPIQSVEPFSGYTVDYLKENSNPNLTKVEFDVGGEKVIA